MVAISKHPEYNRMEKEGPAKKKGRMKPIPQITSTSEMERTMRGLKYETHRIRFANTSIG
jgi:hypothetical protein